MMLGAVPALLLMFYILRPFEGIFDEQSTLFSFVIGMVVGTVVGVLHGQIDPIVVPYAPTALLVFVVGFAFFDQFMRVVFFNSSRFSGRKDTTFYSTAFGLGYGAMLVGLWFFRTFENDNVTVNAYVVVGYLCATFAFAVFHGVTGMLVGFGATEKILWRFGLLAVGLECVLNVLWYVALASSLYTPEGVAPVWELGTLVMVIAAVAGFLLLRWALRKVVPDLLPDETMRSRRRMLRKRHRDGTRR